MTVNSSFQKATVSLGRTIEILAFIKFTKMFVKQILRINSAWLCLFCWHLLLPKIWSKSLRQSFLSLSAKPALVCWKFAFLINRLFSVNKTLFAMCCLLAHPNVAWQARSPGGHSGALKNFVVSRKICFKHIVKKIFPPKYLFFIPNLKTWLRSCSTVSIGERQPANLRTAKSDVSTFEQGSQLLFTCNYSFKYQKAYSTAVPWSLISKLSKHK